MATYIPTGTAGTPNASVVTIQGITGMEPVEVTGDLTVSAGTESTTQAALERGGNLERIARLLEARPDLYELVLTLADGVREGAFRVDLRRWLGSEAPTVGQKAMSASIPVTIASDQTVLPGSVTVTNAVATTRPLPYVDDSCRTRIASDERVATEETLQQVLARMLDVDTFEQRVIEPRAWNPRVCACMASTTSMVMLTTNASRRMASVFNDSTATLYLLFAPGTASSSYYSVKLVAGAYFEFTQPIYPGQVSGVWSAANGSALVTEFS